MLFEIGWGLLSYFFSLGGSYRGLMALGIGGFGFFSKFRFISWVASFVSYFFVPEAPPTWLSIFFVYLRPLVLLVESIFIFSACSHLSNILLKTIEVKERLTQTIILSSSSLFYSLSIWMLVSIFQLSTSTAITTITVCVLLVLLLSHLIAIAGLGTLFEISSAFFLCFWCLRLAVQDNMDPSIPNEEILQSILPFITATLSFLGLLAVPIVLFYDEADITGSWRTILSNWNQIPYRYLITVISCGLYLYELFGAIQQNLFRDHGLWRTCQAILFVLLVFLRFIFRAKERSR